MRVVSERPLVEIGGAADGERGQEDAGEAGQEERDPGHAAS
jgi:hypothetical protein